MKFFELRDSMLDQDTKRKINNCRDILVGKVPGSTVSSSRVKCRREDSDSFQRTDKMN